MYLVHEGRLEEIVTQSGGGEDQHQQSRIQVHLIGAVGSRVWRDNASKHAGDQNTRQDHHRVRTHNRQEQQGIYHTHSGDGLRLMQRAEEITTQNDDEECRAEGLQTNH